MKKYEIGLTISVLLTFTLTMIVIFTGVFIIFFSINDFTIVAALIGVVGAVIGGAISGGLTLFGVRYTIKHEKDIRNKDQIPSKIELIRKSEFNMKTIINNANLMPSRVFEDFDIFKDVLFENASKIDIDCYNELLKIVEIIDHINKNGIETDNEIVDSVGRPTITEKGYSDLEVCKEALIDYQELLNKKMFFYQKELSK